MQHQGVPPEIVSQLDPLALIILIPICDLFIYPALRNAGIKFTPIKKIALGFICVALAMLWSAVIQNYIYHHNPLREQPLREQPFRGTPKWRRLCSSHYLDLGAVRCLRPHRHIRDSCVHRILGVRLHQGAKEHALEAVALFMTAIASAIGEAMVPLSTDPLLVWNYGAFVVIAFLAGIAFWFSFRRLDAEKDALNNLPTVHVGTAVQAAEVNQRSSVASEYAARAAQNNVEEQTV